MRTTNTKWTNWNKAPLRLCQIQLNFVVVCASSACRVSFEHLNCKKQSWLGHYIDFTYIITWQEFSKYYRFHCLTKLVLILMIILTVMKNSLNCVRNIKFPMTPWGTEMKSSLELTSMWWSDYIGPDSMTPWIIKKSQGFTNVGLLKISKSVRAYAYLILHSQASARSRRIGKMASAITAQKSFLDNF